MKGWMASLILLMLVAAMMPAASASERIQLRAGVTASDIEVEVESENETDDSDQNETDDSDRNETDGSDDVREEIRAEYKDGGFEIREERRVEFDGLRERLRLRAQNGTNVTVRELIEYRNQVLEDLKERRQALLEDRKEYVAQARERIKEEREQLDELRGRYKERRDGFLEARAELKERCDSPRSDECKAAREELNSEAKGFMGNAAAQMLRIIDTLKVRVEADTSIGNETAADLIAQLDARALAIEQAQARIDAINGTDLNATKTAAEALRTAWSEARVTIRLTEGLLAHAQFEHFIGQLERMESRFLEARDQFAAEGKDVAQLDADIAAFSAKIDASRESYVSARDAYVSAMADVKTETDANALLKSTRDQLKASENEAKDAREDLRAIVKDIRALSADVLAKTAVKLQQDREAEVEVEA